MRVLIVEDSAVDARRVREYLSENGETPDVQIVSRLDDALSFAGNVKPDAVLLDMSLADTPGVDAVRRMRSAMPNVPIVVLSGLEDEQIATEAVQAGAQDYLLKAQLNDVTLRRALRYAIERQQLLERIAESEARLQEENALLRSLTDAAGRVFATLDARAVIGLLAAEARRLWGGSATLYTAEQRLPDAFLKDALSSPRPVLSIDGKRLALPIPGTSGRNEWILDIGNASGVFGANDVFALELLRQYVGIAIQNVALFGELQSQRASVIQLNQLKDDLIAVLAHDFKGPLTTIIGFTELLEQHAVEGEEAESALRTIRNSATRLAGLANDTLAMSRVEQGELNLESNPVSVADIVRDTVEAFSSERAIELDIAAKDPVVRGDPARLRQVYENIIGNAVKYSPNDSAVRVRVTATEDTVRVTVADKGIGIPADEMRFLFERFRRASNAKRSSIKGTGLGLYLAKTLVERHGGNITVQSKVNEGSSFSIVLPRMRDGMGGMLRVVVLTADDRLGPYILHELRRNGYACRRDKTLTALLERLEVEQADIVIVDCDTVTADKSPLFTRARKERPPIALIAVSAERPRSGKWSAVLPNPFLASDLRQAVQGASQSRVG